jgi:hypothetical protein
MQRVADASRFLYTGDAGHVVSIVCNDLISNSQLQAMACTVVHVVNYVTILTSKAARQVIGPQVAGNFYAARNPTIVLRRGRPVLYLISNHPTTFPVDGKLCATQDPRPRTLRFRDNRYTRNRKYGSWKVGYVMLLLGARAGCPRPALCHAPRLTSTFTDDEESDSGPASPTVAPIARRSKFDDEEEDSDVRQPCPALAQLVAPPCTTPKK